MERVSARCMLQLLSYSFSQTRVSLLYSCGFPLHIGTNGHTVNRKNGNIAQIAKQTIVKRNKGTGQLVKDAAWMLILNLKIPK